jgi:hypothetical protein
MCQFFTNLSGGILFTMTTVVMLLSGGVLGITVYYLAEDIDFVGMPTYLLWTLFALAFGTMLGGLCGCVGTARAYKQAAAKAEFKVFAIVAADDDAHAHGYMRAFLCFTFIFSLLNIAVATLALYEAGELGESDVGSEAAAQRLAAVDSAGISVYEHLDSTDGATSEDWVKTQDFFKCCGYNRLRPDFMTGGCCSNWVEPDAGGSMKLRDPEVDGACRLCSDEFSEMFRRAGTVSLCVGAVELLTFIAGCGLLRCAARRDGGKDRRYSMN